ncbi:MAG: TIGR00300 family protein [Actinobacteria bacterium]|nr:TIGR00300 family protein [Actinomycetota bacterium]MBV9252780.1 TIGR00300 family protein [Actinomycetota bacterium]MBV9665545.1 TIGR00300 family protein [Actinomycetota bacterium]MBV9933081.1 TIGR00300 family protein [Actinomycetota bacterium]
MASEVIEVEGHIIDSLILAKVLDVILAAGADYQVLDVDIGKTNADTSRVQLEVRAGDDDALTTLLTELQVHGANRVHVTDAELVVADRDGVLPPGFYSTTNLPTAVRIEGHWVDCENPEMDCGLLVTSGNRVRTAPMHKVRAGDRFVVGSEGVRVTPLERPRGANPFEFMASEVSSEKPKGLLVADVAHRIRLAKDAGGKVLAVCGPAVIHTGAGPDVARLVEGGWIDVLFAGNGFATHDIESNVLGTSLGISVQEGVGTEGGHSNHLRVINEVRRYGSIAAAVDAGYVDGGVMYECVRRGVPFVLGGSVRDDGPLPDVYPNVVEAADAMRYLLPGVTVALMLASTLHAIATGNLLPAGVETFCVDINQAVVTKLADRGSHQALGIVTDVGLFTRDLCDQLLTS